MKTVKKNRAALSFKGGMFFCLGLLILAGGIVGCGGLTGWTQTQRDQVVNGCVDKAKAGAPSLDETKLRNYCSCYQQALEKKYTSVISMSGAKTEDLTQVAQGCLPLMFK